MILQKLVLQNFRQFYGTQEVVFAPPGTRNVTLIHAENGFGKTALLNSLAWVLYDQLSEDFEKPDEIINQRAVSELGDAAEAAITLQFSDSGDHFTVTRKLARSQQQRKDRPPLHVSILKADGHTFTVPLNPDVVVEGVLPKAMWRYFFFNGERIDHLSRDRAAKEIGEAIQRILGLTLLQQTRDDLRTLIFKHFRDEVAKYSDADTRKAKAERDKVEAALVRLNGELEQLGANEVALVQQRDEIDQALRKNEATRALQKRRDQLKQDLERLEAELDNQKGQICDWITSSGGYPFANGIIALAEEILVAKRTRGEIPSRFRLSFINELLLDGRCICERPLEKGTCAYESVERRLRISGDDVVEEACNAAHSALTVIKHQAERDTFRLRQLTSEKYRVSKQIGEIRDELSEIAHQIGDRESEAGTSLESSRQSIELHLRDIYSKQAVAADQISGLNKFISKADAAIARGARLERSAALAHKRLTAAEDTCALIEHYLACEASAVRANLSREINSSFQQMCRKDYWAELDENYMLRIRKRVRANSDEVVDVAKSTGENQITSLAFIGSLVKLARERESHQSNFALGGGTFPVVMDSPFGSLDHEYREGIAAWIPTVAPQVIILATGSQWEGVVEKVLRPRVGREYLMVYHGPRPPKEGARSTIQIGGREYSQVQVSSRYEHTAIEETAL